jgi:hypothetical protein
MNQTINFSFTVESAKSHINEIKDKINKSKDGNVKYYIVNTLSIDEANQHINNIKSELNTKEPLYSKASYMTDLEIANQIQKDNNVSFIKRLISLFY